MDYAKNFEAIVFLLEHRFYGKSRPTRTLKLENLQYLSIRQALADSANFIKGMNEKYNLPKDVKWIAFGVSYAGSLAAWLRLSYPHFVHGAVTIGAPLLAKMNLEESNRILADIIRSHSEECVMAVERGFEQAVSLLETEKGQQSLYNLFKLCTEINSNTTKHDIAVLFLSFVDNFKYISYLSDESNNEYMEKMCQIMTSNGIEREVERLAEVNRWILKEKRISCIDYDFEGKMDVYRYKIWQNRYASTSDIQWNYQLCGELGFFPTSDSKPHIFSDTFPLDFFITKCQSAYSSTFNHDFIEYGVDNTNLFYGGKDIQVSNVVFVYGSLDPWKSLGITKTANPGSTVIIINGYGTSLGFRAPAETDSLELIAARKKIQLFIGGWLEI